MRSDEKNHKAHLLVVFEKLHKERAAMILNDSIEKDEKITVRVDAELEDLIPGYLENRHKDAKEIQAALASGIYETIRTIGHSMKGSGGGYGFNTISAIGSSLEYAAKEKYHEEIRRRLNELIHYLENVYVIYK
jgi:HPt (histidine-containing phosphotransfer) domain-containing protein